MKKKYKVLMIILAIFILIVGGLLVYRFVFYKKDEVKLESKVVSEIKDYGYTLDDRDTEIFLEVFNELKDILGEDEVISLDYCKALSKLFVIDFYTLSTKINRYDVGALEYVYPSVVEMFRLKAVDTIYKEVVDNSDSKRTQELPEVVSVDIVESNEVKYKMDEEEVDAFEIKLKWEYVKDLGYDKEGVLTFVKKDNKYYVVEFTPLLEELDD